MKLRSSLSPQFKLCLFLFGTSVWSVACYVDSIKLWQIIQQAYKKVCTSSFVWTNPLVWGTNAVCSYLGLLYDLSHVMWVLSNCGRSYNRPIRKSVPVPLSGPTLWFGELMLLVLIWSHCITCQLLWCFTNHTGLLYSSSLGWTFYTDTLVWNNPFFGVLHGPLP